MIKWLKRKFFGIEAKEKEELREVVLGSLEQHRYLEEAIESNQAGPQPIASVTFYIDSTNHIHMNYHWQERDASTARNMAQMLMFINSGELEQGCVKVLQKIGVSHPEEHAFIESIFEKWLEYKEDADVVVKPSQVFNLGYNRERQGP